MNENAKDEARGFAAWLLCISLFIAASVSGLAPAPSSTFAGFLLAMLVGSHFTLLAVWLGIGNGSFLVRLLLVEVGAVPMIELLTGGDLPVAALAFSMLLIPLMALPSGLARVIRFRLVIWDQYVEPIGVETPGSTRQFSLRQIFDWTTATAMLVGLAGMAIGGPGLGQHGLIGPVSVIDILTVLFFGFAAYCAAWAVLSPTQAVRRFLALSGVLLLVSEIVLAAIRAPANAGWEFAITASFYFATIGCVLAMFRAIGYRIVRVDAAGSTGQDKVQETIRKPGFRSSVSARRRRPKSAD